MPLFFHIFIEKVFVKIFFGMMNNQEEYVKKNYLGSYYFAYNFSFSHAGTHYHGSF